jgi:hypothetical protein
MSTENLNKNYGPLPRKNKCQKCLGKFRNLQQIGMAFKDNPAFFHMGAVPKGWKLLLMSLG